MSITLSTTYKETLPAEIVAIVDNLVEDGYDLEDVLIVLDYFGEENYENLVSIFEMLEDTGASKSDLYDYIEEQGIDELEYFDKYQEMMDNYDEGAVKAFLEMYSVSDLHHFEEAYEGYFDDVEAFVDNFMENSGEEIPTWVVVDYSQTWESSLRFDYDEENGYYFRSSF
jgi:2-phosphoglycerate kinase